MRIYPNKFLLNFLGLWYLKFLGVVALEIETFFTLIILIFFSPSDDTIIYLIYYQW